MRYVIKVGAQYVANGSSRWVYVSSNKLAAWVSKRNAHKALLVAREKHPDMEITLEPRGK